MKPLEKYMYPFYLRVSKLQSCFYFKLNSSVEVLATNLDAKQYLITTLALMVSKYCCCQDKNQRSPLLHSEPNFIIQFGNCWGKVCFWIYE